MRARTAAVTALAVAGLLAGLASCVSYTSPPAPTLAALRAAPPAAAPPVTVYLVHNGFHAGLTLPTAALLAHPGATAAAVARLPPRPWISLGYGDSKFYQGQGINPVRVLDILRATFKPGNPSVIDVEGVGDPLADRSGSHVLRLSIPADRVPALVAKLDASFALRGGAPVFVAEGLDGPADKFFLGSRPASGVHECNHWIGDVLGAAGVPHTPWLDTASPSLAFDLQHRGYAEPVP